MKKISKPASSTDALMVIPSGFPIGMNASEKLRLQEAGYSVMASRSQAGRFRWWRETGSDGVSVPRRELSEKTFATADEAWESARDDEAIVGATSKA